MLAPEAASEQEAGSDIAAVLHQPKYIGFGSGHERQDMVPWLLPPALLVQQCKCSRVEIDRSKRSAHELLTPLTTKKKRKPNCPILDARLEWRVQLPPQPCEFHIRKCPLARTLELG